MTTTVTPTYTPGRFVWRELYTRDVALAKRFYQSLFGWSAEDVPMGPDWSYTLWKIGDKQIGGMMDLNNLPNEGAGVPPHWAVFVSVDDVAAAAARAVANGGKLVSDCMDIPDVGRTAVIQDPQGGHLSLFRSLTGDPADVEPGLHEFCWETLATTDATAASAFYRQVVGWTVRPMAQAEDTVLFARKAGSETRDVASVGPAPEGSPAYWGTFVSVADIPETSAKCRSLGGKVLVERTEIPVGAFGVIEDPTGAVLFLFTPNR